MLRCEVCNEEIPHDVWGCGPGYWLIKIKGKWVRHCQDCEKKQGDD